MNVSIYKEVLMDHYHHPRNRGDVSNADVICRGRNSRCGDDIEIGVIFEGEKLKQIVFHGRGCSVCVASASMMTEVATGLMRKEVKRLYQEIKTWLSPEQDIDIPLQPPKALHALSVIREYPARHRCMLLAWDALQDAVS